MEVRVREILEELLELREQSSAFDSNGIPATDREFLIQQMGWLGKLAMTPAASPNASQRSDLEQTATIATVAVISAGLLFIVVLLAGLVALGIFTVLTLMGRLQSRTIECVNSGPVYLETFTIWLLTFIGLQEAAQWVGVPPNRVLTISPLIFGGSLVALLWPVLRGIPFRKVLADIGLTSSRPVSDVVFAVPCYMAVVPMVVVAGVLNLVRRSFEACFIATCAIVSVVGLAG
jgi:hypothetical protein